MTDSHIVLTMELARGGMVKFRTSKIDFVLDAG